MSNQIVNNQQTADNHDKLMFLLADNNTTASIILVEKACEQYHKLYKKYDVPFSYIDFFCEEFNKYSGLFTNALKEFYDDFKKLNITAEDIIDRYCQSYYSQHKGIRVTKDEKYLSFPEEIMPNFTKEMREVTNLNASTLVENIINICHKIDTQDELINNIELYERYMITNYIKNYQFKPRKRSVEKKISKPNKAEPQKAPASDKVTLVGSALEDKYESNGKITKIIIPKLSLPTIYPISQEESRIQPGKRVKFLCSPARQIVFINRKKIVAVKYSNKFLDKRNKPVAKKKFDWDF